MALRKVKYILQSLIWALVIDLLMARWILADATGTEAHTVEANNVCGADTAMRK